MTDLFARPFDELAPGLRFTTTGRTVTEGDVVGFAGLTGDFHPQHVDAAWARGSLFGERIAHGLLVLSIGAGMIPFRPDRVVALRRVRDVVFKRPVRLGDTITTHGELRELTPLDDATGLVAVGLAVQVDGRAAVRGTVEVLWAREPGRERDADADREPDLLPADPMTCVPL